MTALRPLAYDRATHQFNDVSNAIETPRAARPNFQGPGCKAVEPRLASMLTNGRASCQSVHLDNLFIRGINPSNGPRRMRAKTSANKTFITKSISGSMIA